MRLHPDSSPDDLYPHLLAALRAWHDSSPENRLEFLLLVREAAAEHPPEDPHTARRITNELIHKCLEALSEQDPEGAEILHDRFVRKQTTVQVAFRLNLSVDQVNKRQKQAILQLAADLLEHERALQDKRSRELEIRLQGRQYSRLIGIDTAIEDLAEYLKPGSPPWLICLHGMGGLGKTALGHALTVQAIADYSLDTILWVRVNQQPGIVPNPEHTYQNVLNELAARLTNPEGSPQSRRDRALQILAARPHLVVIDNLEQKSDTAYLLEKLSAVQGPGKFLLTTRSGLVGTSGVFNYHVPELNREHAAELIRFHSQDIGMGDTAISADEDVESIYAAVGGNPLAIKILVGMAAQIPLSAALAGLQQGRLVDADQMFGRVYTSAWEALSQDARDLMEGLLLVSDETGAGTQQLLAVSGLPESRLWPAIQELLGRSLLEVYGTATERRYGIHQLTRTFLQSRLSEKE